MTSATHVAERLAQAIIPDLDGRSVYAVDAPELASPYGGCYHLSLLRAVQPTLEAQGRWRGDGVAIVVAADHEPDDFDGERSVIGLALHELAHWLDRDETSTEPTEPIENFDTVHARTIELHSQPSPIPHAFWRHSNSFIRLCCHLWYRSSHSPRDGYLLDARYLGFANSYPGLELLSSPAAYVHSLRDELPARQDERLRDIVASDPPREFSELWQRDSDLVFDTALERQSA